MPGVSWPTGRSGRAPARGTRRPGAHWSKDLLVLEKADRSDASPQDSHVECPARSVTVAHLRKGHSIGTHTHTHSNDVTMGSPE